MFYGEKLRESRELHGLSRKELAEKLEISEQAVWQYENQYTVPKFDIINALKKVLSVKPQFFYSDSFVKEVASIDRIAYRSDDRDSRKKAKMELNYINYVNHFITYFEKSLAIPNQSIYSLKSKAEDKLFRNNKSIASNEKSIKDVALLARKQLNVEHNKDLLYKLELSGIYILEKNMGLSIDAYSTWTNDNVPFIVLGTQKKSSVRRNFDLAHELGHLLMHGDIDMDGLTKEELRQVEKEANDFASFFLLPEENFVTDFHSISKKSNPDSYIDLKMKYHVSIAAMEYRAYKLNLLTFEENRYFYSALNRLNYKKIEPLDEDIPVIKPGKIRALLKLIFENHLLILDTELENFSIERTFLESLFGIDDQMLKQYEDQTRLDYFVDKVISLY